VRLNIWVNHRYGIIRPDHPSSSGEPSERPLKRSKKGHISFRDQAGGELIQVVGISDGADVGPSPGLLGVKEGSLVGKYESLVQVTVIPRGKDLQGGGAHSPKGSVTEKLQRVMDKVKNGPKSGEGIYDGIFGEAVKEEVGGSSWAYKLDHQDDKAEKNVGDGNVDDDADDLFGD
jgi:nuclear inhibitor of protein phosphatase 1